MPHIPIRTPDCPGHPPRLAVHLYRTVSPRPDLMGRPQMVIDKLMMDDNDVSRHLQNVQLFAEPSAAYPPLVPVIAYLFPYARSRRSKISWKRAHVAIKDCRHAC